MLEWLDPTFQIENVKSNPKLLEKIPNKEHRENHTDGMVEEETENHLYLAYHVDIQTAFESYIRDQWTPWKDEIIRFEKIQDIYTKLFSIYQKQKKLGEQYELQLELVY